jgi:hypothetical protein
MMFMLAKLSVLLLLAASPAAAAEPAPADAAEPQAPPQQYKTKKVCRSIEVVGSSIPRTTCTTKKIPVKPAKADVAAEPAPPPESETPAGE